MAGLVQRAALLLSAAAIAVTCGCGGSEPAPAQEGATPAASATQAKGAPAKSARAPSPATVEKACGLFAEKVGKAAAEGWPAHVRYDEATNRPAALVEVERPEEDADLARELNRALLAQGSLALVEGGDGLRARGTTRLEHGRWVVEVWLIDARGAILTRSLAVE